MELGRKYGEPTAQDKERIRAYIQFEADALIRLAKEKGFVVEIRLAPQFKLAMGSYEMEASVRAARKSAACEHKRSAWTADMRCGRCNDCGARLGEIK